VSEIPWTTVCAISDCPEGEAREFAVSGRIVAIFHVEGQFYSMDGICPHQGGPLGKGTLNGCVLTCPWHGWQYNVTNGQHETNKSIQHSCFETRVADNQVQVRLTDDF